MCNDIKNKLNKVSNYVVRIKLNEMNKMKIEMLLKTICIKNALKPLLIWWLWMRGRDDDNEQSSCCHPESSLNDELSKKKTKNVVKN
jgi:hypothetical protein